MTATVIGQAVGVHVVTFHLDDTMARDYAVQH
jgi:hypothetical protein